VVDHSTYWCPELVMGNPFESIRIDSHCWIEWLILYLISYRLPENIEIYIDTTTTTDTEARLANQTYI